MTPDFFSNQEKTKLIHLGLEALLREQALKQLASFYGKVPKAKAGRRNRL